MQETFNDFLNFLKSNSIRMTYEKFDPVITNLSYFYIDEEHPLVFNFYQQNPQFIVVDQYIEKIKEDTYLKYLIISFSDSIIIVEDKNLALIQNIFTGNEHSNFFFLSGTNKYFNLTQKENSSENEIFQKEISNFARKFSVKKSNDQSVIKIWSIIILCLSGYLIKKSYYKKTDRIGTFFLSEKEEFDKIEIKENDYIVLRLIGQGSSAFVQLIYHIEKAELYALKQFNIQESSKNQNREVEYYQTISHPFISKCIGFLSNKESKGIVIEYIKGINLDKIEFLSKNQKFKIIFEILIIIQYLHNNHYIYRDLKPNNIIINDENKSVVLIDFDRMIKSDIELNNSEFTKDFASSFIGPEVIEGKTSYASDIFSIGLMIYYILTIEMRNKKEFNFSSDLNEFKNIPEEFNGLKEICKRCVRKNPEERPNISELITEFYLKFYSTIQNDDKLINKEDIKTLLNDNDKLNYTKYWVSLDEFQNKYAKIYRKSFNFYIDTVRYLKIKQFDDTNQISIENCSFFENYQSKIELVQNEYLKAFYSNFVFHYSNVNENEQISFENFLFDYLKRFKFITYQITHIDNIIICVEGECIIIKNADLNIFDKIITKIKENQSFVINACSKNNDEIEEEIHNFCEKFKDVILNNEFIANTIKPIACYLIRRYFYPTEYFEDQSFFIFDNQISKERKSNFNFINKIKTKKGEDMYYEFKLMQERIINNFSTENRKQQQQITNEFNEKDFIKLRTLFSNQNATFYLALHLENQHICMIKVLSEISDHDISICQKLIHRTITPFIGFLKENEKIFGFVYEFMSNGTLESYITLNYKKNTPLFSLLTLSRIFEGIDFLNENSLCYPSLNPSNIFLDHDCIPYIFDYENISQRGEQSNSNLEDINNFCKIINFLYDKTHQLQKLSDYYSKNSIKNISDYENIKIIIIEEMINFDNFEQTLLNEQNDQNLMQLAQLFFEYNIIQYEKSENVDLCNKIFSAFSIINKCREDKFSFYFILGMIYYYAKITNKNYSKSIKYFELSEKIDSDNTFALNAIAYSYKNGYGVKKDILKAIEYFEKSAKLNNSSGNFLLGLIYENGLNGKIDYNKAVKYYEIACKLKNPSAMLNLGCLYFIGNGVKINYQKAKEYFEMASKYYEVNSIKNLAYLYKKGLGVNQDYAKAKELYEFSARLGNDKALYELGFLYLNGIGVSKNYSKAKECFEMAAEFNNPESLYMLGYCYENGVGVQQDYLKAKKYYELALKFNIYDSYHCLGSFYYNGYGVKQDYLKAKEYFELSAKLNKHDKNKLDSIYGLGDIYFNGKGVEKNYFKAKEYFEIAAAQNHSESIIFLGYMYEYGYGVKQDISKAIHLFESAAKLANSKGLLNIGVIYYKGLGVLKNYSIAKKYFELAAQYNNSQALLNIGIMYYCGTGMKKDYDKSLHYIKLSASLKNSDALNWLGYFELNSNNQEPNYKKAIEYFEQSAQLNNIKSIITLGKFYFTGYIVKQDYKKAKYYFEQGAKLKDSESIFFLGLYYSFGLYSEQNYIKAIEYFKLSASMNNSKSYLYLGHLYANGLGVNLNINEAIKYFTLASKLNNSEALNKLGYIYWNGVGVERNLVKAKKYFELSTQLQNPYAFYILGYFYYNGYFGEIDSLKAKKYLELSASLDYSSALFYLGKYYSDGDVFEIDIPKAIFYYKKCLEHHFSKIFQYIPSRNCYVSFDYNEYYYHSCNDLGLIYILLKQDKENLEIGLNYLKESGFNEYPYGQNNLGLFYQYFDNHIGNAIHMYERSFKNHFPLSAFNLGYINEKENINKSIKYYIKVSEFEKEPLMYRNQNYEDKRLEISIKFIVCLTNLKLTKYFYSEKEFSKCKEFFIKSFSIISNSRCQFQFHYHTNPIDLFLYLKYCIFNYSPFNLINQPNLNQRIIKKLNFLNEKYLTSTKIKNEMAKSNYLINNNTANMNNSMKIESNDHVKYKNKKERIKNNQTLIDSDQSIFKNFVIINDLAKLFDNTIENQNLIIELIKEIEEIIDIMNEIVFTPPFPILFGRISIEKKMNDIFKYKTEINTDFYEGFDI